jgi:uncharacterized protein
MRSLPLSKVRVTDPFWSRWQKVLVDTTLPHEFDQLESTGRLANFRRAAGKEEGGYASPFWFDDSDTYKWLEACAYALVWSKDKGLRAKVDQAVSLIEAAQMDDGYINTFFQLRHPELRWRNLNTMHEMYCGGHLIEAGVAMAENLGDKRLLGVAIRFADHVMSVFGPDKRRGYCGHQEIELALLRLSELTNERKYVEFARWMIEERGQRPSVFEEELKDEEAMALSPHAVRMLTKDGQYVGDYAQDHAPLREHTEVVGHAVRAMYYYIAAAHVAEGREDIELEETLHRVWYNLTNKRMYITGGIGPSASNEGFTADYDLPNLNAYAETCAACGLALWGQAMLELTGNSEFADVVERTLYNGAISGISLSGDRFFYVNPLESRGSHERTPWFSCACCPPNIARIIGKVSQFAVAASSDTFYVHFPAGVEVDTEFQGVPVKIAIESNYPWSGEATIKIEPQRPVEFTLAVRIPGWADDVGTEIPGAEEEAGYDAGYALFRRTWKAGDVLKLDLEMTPKWVEADPRVRDNLGRVALTYGPLVYCAERHDLGFAPQLFAVDPEAEVEVHREKLLEGITTLTAEGMHEVESFPEGLYAEVGTTEAAEARAKFIPYYVWNNRGATSMQVWIRRI